jgi:hypothetical protein
MAMVVFVRRTGLDAGVGLDALLALSGRVMTYERRMVRASEISQRTPARVASTGNGAILGRRLALSFPDRRKKRRARPRVTGPWAGGAVAQEWDSCVRQ